MRKEIKKLAKVARAQRWAVEQTNGGHLRWRSPNGGSAIYSPRTPSDWRSLRNLKARLRQCGLEGI